VAVSEKIIQDVQRYYGTTLKESKDLKTGACCTTASAPAYLKPLRDRIHPEVVKKYYGCGSPIPNALKGLTVLDLGCGSGVDCYLLAQLVGEAGRVIGVDMTRDQIAVAREFEDYHRNIYGYDKKNTEFHLGYIEDLKSLGLGDNSVDLVISNCVINLSPHKAKVFAEIFRILKPGGELYFSDVFASRRVPATLRNDPVLIGECLSGALYHEDFRRLLLKLGIQDYRIVTDNPVELRDEAIISKIGMIDFRSLTIRTFKIDFEDICENYGHVAFYNGTLPESPHEFHLDDHHVFKKGLPVPVCGNTAKMLTLSRYGKYFQVVGDFSTHYGKFPCGPEEPVAVNRTTADGSCC